MDYQEPVANFLTGSRDTVFIRNYRVEHGTGKRRYDFLGVNSRRKKIFIVEVAATADPAIDRLVRIAAQDGPGLRQQLERYNPGDEMHAWPIEVCVFIGHEHVRALKSQAPEAGLPMRVFPL